MLPVINCALRKWQTSQKWACFFFVVFLSVFLFRGGMQSLSLLPVPPSISPLCLQRNPSSPLGRSLRLSILGSVWTHLCLPCSKAVRTAAEYLWVSFDTSTSSRCCFFLVVNVSKRSWSIILYVCGFFPVSSCEMIIYLILDLCMYVWIGKKKRKEKRD